MGMSSFKRILDIENTVKSKSVFLFGPRQTGKTFLLKHTLVNAKWFNLLEAETFLNLSLNPGRIRDEVTSGKSGPVIIDEIQKLPSLLDEVQDLIESRGIKFVLTGSSARKLKRSGVNMLGGRARVRYLFSLTFAEIPDYNLHKAISIGTIPSVYTSDDPHDDLTSYCGTYLQQEIQSEGISRNIEGFSRFLQTAAIVNGTLINMHSIASDAQLSPRTVSQYFSILEDTLIGTMVEPFNRTKRRKAVSTAKFYFFDVGVANTLAGRSNIVPRTELFGNAFEHLIFTELRSYISYTRDERPLSFWRDRYGHEVDFIIGDNVGIEVKGTSTIDNNDLKGLHMLQEEIPLKHKVVVSLDKIPRKIGDIEILPWNIFLTRLWNNEFR
ncbi:AAA+ superfamily protein [sediment metagenome]|uniref:AAA+ superfamily protein n=1 Tax=sediment metagenome TaxID=749907 RepID=D9PHJ9_9ZZZZ